jgi:hypothetical protein
MGLKPATPQKFDDKEAVKKWGKILISDGFTIIPNAIIEHQAKLGLEAIDFAIIAIFAKYWWKANEPPFPGKKRIAACLGVEPRTIQRRLAALVKANVLTRKPRKYVNGGTNTNAYELGPLITKAEPYAEDELRQREARREKKTVRGLRLVKP